ncbi:MAG: NAD(P)H-dependent oxidoreductase subunit E [Anaerolineae bacterium]
MPSHEDRARVPDELQRRGGLKPGVAREVARATGVPEADVYGVGSFFHLLAEPDVDVRVCQGLSCQLAGAAELLEARGRAGCGPRDASAWRRATGRRPCCADGACCPP